METRHARRAFSLFKSSRRFLNPLIFRSRTIPRRSLVKLTNIAVLSVFLAHILRLENPRGCQLLSYNCELYRLFELPDIFTTYVKLNPQLILHCG